MDAATEPRFVADMRANLTDELYEEMTDNPDDRAPFLVNWPLVEVTLAFG